MQSHAGFVHRLHMYPSVSAFVSLLADMNMDRRLRLDRRL